MTWVSNYNYLWYEKFAMNIIRSGGHIPRHIAFVMDGNRRFAQSQCLNKIDGHIRGFDKLADCLRWCLDLGVEEVTAFAFSIENFKRTEEEVNGLLNLAREKFIKVIDEVDKLREHGVRIQVIGNVSLLPLDIQQLIATAMVKTENNDKLFLNIAFSYTSSDEITQAVESILLHGNEHIETEDINEHLLEECLYTRHSSEPNLLIRTSGETRISDFLMWQLSSTILYFTKIHWPRITIWNFLAAIFLYQRVSKNPWRQNRIKELVESKKNNIYTNRVQCFLEYLNENKKNVLHRLSNLCEYSK